MTLKSKGGLLLFVFALLLGLSPLARAAESLDPAFGKGGISFPGLNGSSVHGLVQDGDGRLISAGGDLGGFLVARYLKNGSLDASFGDGKGYMTTDLGFDSVAWAVAAQRDGKILAAGSAFPPTAVLARYGEDGPRDLGFGKDGQTRVHVGRKGGGARDVAVLPSGRIYVAGYGIDEKRRWTAMVVAFRPDGVLDERFGSDGMVRLRTEGDSAIAFDAMTILPSGKILLAGDLNGLIMAIRLLPSGKPDPSFSGDGQAYVDVDGARDCPCAYADGLALDRQGRAVVLANVTGRGREPAALIRYLPNGKLDRGFGEDGIVHTLLGGRLAGHDVAIQRNGRIVLAGAYNVPKTGEARVAVIRYLPNGALDRGFARRGVFTRDFGVEGVAYAVLVQRDGRVVVGGRANPEPSPFHENESVLDTAEVFLIRFLP